MRNVFQLLTELISICHWCSWSIWFEPVPVRLTTDQKSLLSCLWWIILYFPITILIVFMVLFSLAHFFAEMQFLQEAGCLYWLLWGRMPWNFPLYICFSFLIPSSEFIFSCNNTLFPCTWAINPTRKYLVHD